MFCHTIPFLYDFSPCKLHSYIHSSWSILLAVSGHHYVELGWFKVMEILQFSEDHWGECIRQDPAVAVDRI